MEICRWGRIFVIIFLEYSLLQIIDWLPKIRKWFRKFWKKSNFDFLLTNNFQQTVKIYGSQIWYKNNLIAKWFFRILNFYRVFITFSYHVSLIKSSSSFFFFLKLIETFWALHLSHDILTLLNLMFILKTPITWISFS